MKKLILPLVLLLTMLQAPRAQEAKDLLGMEVSELFKQKRFHEAINGADEFTRRFNNHNVIQLIRAYSWLGLNDMVNLRKDLENTMGNHLVLSSQPFLKAMIDKEFMAELVTENYITDPDLDPERDYRPRLTYCDTVRGMLMPNRSCYNVTFYDLSVRVDPKDKFIAGKNKIHFTVLDPTLELQVDLFDLYSIEELLLDGVKTPYEWLCHAVLIHPGRELLPGEEHTIEISYSGHPIEAPRPPWNGGFVWSKNGKKPWVGVACEHLGASSWWPCKDYLADKPDSMRITVTVPAPLDAISNGSLRSVEAHDDKTVSYEWFVSYPINSYNVTLYAGEFENFSEVFSDENSSYQVDYYVLKKNLKKARKYYAQTGKILEVFGELFGEYPYPKDGAGFVEAPFAGMEHQGAVAIGDGYKRNFERIHYEDKEYAHIMVHETAHEWWGNTVAFGDMADAWISEAFATYSEFLFLEKVYGYPEYLNAFGNTSQTIFNSWPMVGQRDVNDNTFLTNDIYTKGAAMLNNLRCIINDDSLFFSIIKGFYQEYKMKIATTDDFIRYVHQRVPYDLHDFFHAFLFQAVPPTLEYSYTLTLGKLLFNYHWVNVGEDFEMPFALVINDTTCVRLNGTKEIQHLTFERAWSFYIPTPWHFETDMALNSFTYFQTCWRRE